MANVQPISDDQELAKVLAGDNQNKQPDAEQQAPNLPPIPPVPETPVQDSQSSDNASSNEDGPAQQPESAPTPEFTVPQPETPAPEQGSAIPSDLSNIKTEALQELRPLVDKLNVTPQEKFDVLLLLLRSTDDSTLVPQAHEAAKDIVDETARAQALLDVIKEIDFLSKPQQ